LKTLGDHLRKKRLDLKLLQKDVAQKIGVDAASVNNWETDRNNPSLAIIPKLIEFLGYIPFEIPAKNLGEKIRAYRQALGLSRKELARELKVDPSTLKRWERGNGRPSKELREKVGCFLASFPGATLAPKE
jgi:transcriptional regulator with XRE-family HTH domain